MSTRRMFIDTFAAVVLTSPLCARAQRTDKVPRVALVFNAVPVAEMTGPDPLERSARAFVHGLRDLGYVDGRNIVIERRSGQGLPERMPALMQELVDFRVDVIVTVGPGAVYAQRATDTVPIVAVIDDPEALGLTASLGRPTRNMTGASDSAAPEIHGKRLQLLKELAPKSARVAVIDFRYIDSRATPGTHLRRRNTEVAASAMGLTLIPVGVDKPEDLEQAFAVMTRDRADALLETGSPIFYAHRRLIIDFAARQGMAAVYTSSEFAESGGLMSYGVNTADHWRRVAAYVDKILKGAKPRDLPFEQPNKFELVINLKTAKALGLTVPQSLLLRADEVIQ